jgi:opacity protein-like surface antigen
LRRKSTTLILLIILTALFSDAGAIERVQHGFGNSNFAGGRLGAWVMTGGEEVLDPNDNPVDLSKSSFYAEFFYAQRFGSRLAGEISLGIFSQGDIEYQSNTNILLGTVNIYTFLLSGKFYPITRFPGTSFYPYVRAGGGLVYGNRDISDGYYYYQDYFIEENQTKFTYLLGAGMDWQVAQQIGITLDFKYVPVKFGKPLAGFEDYSGWELSIGVGYVWPK